MTEVFDFPHADEPQAVYGRFHFDPDTFERLEKLILIVAEHEARILALENDRATE